MAENKKATNKISYNPFRMWGSWVGLIIHLTIPFFSIFLFLGETASSTLSKIFLFLLNLISIFLAPTVFIVYVLSPTQFWNAWTTLIIFGISGFLYGWAIHSLIRYLKNRNSKSLN